MAKHFRIEVFQIGSYILYYPYKLYKLIEFRCHIFLTLRKFCSWKNIECLKFFETRYFSLQRIKYFMHFLFHNRFLTSKEKTKRNIYFHILFHYTWPIFSSPDLLHMTNIEHKWVQQYRTLMKTLLPLFLMNLIFFSAKFIRVLLFLIEYFTIKTDIISYYYQNSTTPKICRQNINMFFVQSSTLWNKCI